MRRRNEPGINLTAKFSVRDFFILISLLMGSGNLYLCSHGRDFQKDQQSQQSQIQPKKESKVNANLDTKQCQCSSDVILSTIGIKTNGNRNK